MFMGYLSSSLAGTGGIEPHLSTCTTASYYRLDNPLLTTEVYVEFMERPCRRQRHCACTS